MRLAYFVLSFVGLSVLLWTFLLLPYRPVESRGELDSLIENSRVSIQGEVEELKYHSYGVSFKIKDVDIRCDCFSIKEGDSIEVKGVLEEYNGKRIIVKSFSEEIL